MKAELIYSNQYNPEWKFYLREVRLPFMWTMYRDNKMGIQMQERELLYTTLFTKFSKKFVKYYFIDGVKGSFRTEKEMMEKYLKLKGNYGT